MPYHSEILPCFFLIKKALSHNHIKTIRGRIWHYLLNPISCLYVLQGLVILPLQFGPGSAFHGTGMFENCKLHYFVEYSIIFSVRCFSYLFLTGFIIRVL